MNTNATRMSELDKAADELRGEKLGAWNKIYLFVKKKISDEKLDFIFTCISTELEAKLENNNEERRALLERCLASEGELEKLREKNSEMRRKLDDTQAALHELGRENQSLQVSLVTVPFSLIKYLIWVFQVTG